MFYVFRGRGPGAAGCELGSSRAPRVRGPNRNLPARGDQIAVFRSLIESLAAVGHWHLGELIDYRTSMITDKDPLRALLFY